MSFPSLPRRILLCTAFLAAAVPFSTHAAQESGASPAAIKAGESYLRALESAGAAYAEHQFSVALDKLDIADQIRPNIPDTWNMRGAIYAEQHDFARAQAAFEKSARLSPSDFWPQYNLAELLLMQKQYPQAVAGFQKLAVYQGHDELVAFKIVFADLLQGKPDDAKPVLDAMKFPCDTAAYYYAHAAWAFAHKDEKEGNYWSHAGLKVFGVERCVSFYDSLVQVGWLPMRNTDGSVPEHTELSTLPAATPASVLPPSGGLQ
jgi:tetratricopeptide (TPR) repeat protein